MTSIYLSQAVKILVVGVVATAVLDLWALALGRIFGLPTTHWGHVGRWVAGLRSGAFQHASIAAVPEVAHERAIGWTTHYLIGVVYAALYLGLLAATSQAPSVLSGALFGVATVAAPWLILQPGLGAGYFARNTPRPNKTRALNLMSHLVFGSGLYLGFLLAD